VNPKTRAWLLILSVFALCGLTLLGVVWYRSRALTPAALLKRLPTDDAVVVFIDFKQLRTGGVLKLLDGAKVGEDPEYQRFVRQTDFDYKQDLDTAIVAFAPEGKFMLLKGQFDWKSLKSYVLSVDGSVNNSFFRMGGSTKDRNISFFPLQSGIMAMAVAQDESAASRMNTVDSRPDMEIPNAPVWLSVPPSVVKSGQSLPPGTQMFARSLDRARSVTLSLAPENDRFAARLRVRCASNADATALAAELAKTTALLRELIEREHQKPNPSDLSGFLTSGTFRADELHVNGYWPVPRALIENLLGAN
jgi:hypothetical protein